MKKLLSFFTLFVLCAGIVYAQSFPVTLKVIDETKKTTVASGAEKSNIIVGVSENLKEQNPKNPDPADWWYPMYNNSGFTPDGLYTENANNITWSITLNAVPGEYTWTPYMKSLGWKFLNNVYLYSSDIDSPVITFTVKSDGSIEGTTEIVIPANQQKFTFSIEVVDMTAGNLTNDLNDPNNTDKNIYAWISGSVSQSADWWTAMYFDAAYGPTSELVKETNKWTWRATFEGPAGVYEWTPSIKSYGWVSMNGRVGNARWEGDNLKFIVAPDGSVSGANILVVNEDSETRSLTLNLDMSGVIVDPAGVHVVGSFIGWDLSQAVQMTDDNGDGIYTVSITLPSSNDPYQYKFINGLEWGKEETVFGNCAYRSNRLVWLTDNDVTVDAVILGNCRNTPMTQTKVACIGDSNTEGAGVSNQILKSWPVQMRDYLSDDYYTDNLGVSGATLMKFPEPWGAWSNNVSNCYENNKKLNPDIILVSLGTNDSKTEYWGTRNFKDEYIDLVNEFKTFSSNPEVYMVIPIKAYTNGFGISDDNIRNGIIPAVNDLSKTQMLPVIDWYTITKDLAQGEYIPDGVHANDVASKMMAEKAAKILNTPKPVININANHPTNYAEYRWYLNGTYIEGANLPTYEATISGTYNIAVKLTADANDVIVSKGINVDIPNGSVTIGLSEPGLNINDSEKTIATYYSNGLLMLPSIKNAKVEIYNISGSLVLRVQQANDYINIEKLPSGAYIGKITNGNQIIISKFVR